MANDAHARRIPFEVGPTLECVAFTIFFVGVESTTLARIAGPDSSTPDLIRLLMLPIGAVAVGLLLPTRGRRIFLGTVGCVAALLAAGDQAYHAFFGTVTSAFMLSSMRQLVAVRSSVASLLSPSALLPILLFAPFFVLAFWRRERAPDDSPLEAGSPARRFPRLVAAATLLVLDAGIALLASHTPILEETHHLGRSPWVRPADHWGSDFSRLTYARTFGLFNYHVSDLADFLSGQVGRSELSDGSRERIESTLARRKQLNDSTSPAYGIARGRHVILLQLESFQHFLLDLKINGHEVTPNLNRLKRQAFNWDYILDVTHIGRTSDAEFAVMTGLLPDVRKPSAFHHLFDDLVTLPKQLTQAGYQTSSIHGFDRSFWNRADSHPAFGIDEMFFEESFDDSDKIGLGPSDRQVFSFASELLDTRRETPQMLFVISLTSHHPYVYVPADYARPYLHLDPRDGYGLAAPYLGSASYTDEAVGFFLDDLEQRGLLEDSLIVIYGDHDRGGLAEQRAIPEVGDRLFSPSEDRVPFMILVPGEEDLIAQLDHAYEGVMGGLQDLYPTVAHLLGESIPSGLLGTHLFVGNTERDALPLPGPPGFFGYRGLLSLGNGEVVRSRSASIDNASLPTAESVLADRLIAQDLLDHYEDVAATFEARALVVADTIVPSNAASGSHP